MADLKLLDRVFILSLNISLLRDRRLIIPS
jgi:hypothetical protein